MINDRVIVFNLKRHIFGFYHVCIKLNNDTFSKYNTFPGITATFRQYYRMQAVG